MSDIQSSFVTGEGKSFTNMGRAHFSPHAFKFIQLLVINKFLLIFFLIGLFLETHQLQLASFGLLASLQQ